MGHAALGTYSVLAVVSVCCPHPEGRLFTCYSPVCHSIPERASSFPLFVRLACVKHAASVRPEPGSNSLFKVRLLSLTFLHLNYCFSLYSQSSYHYMKFLMFHNNHYIIQHLFLVVNTFLKNFLLNFYKKSDPALTGSLLYQLF